jgi:hypothetical protein
MALNLNWNKLKQIQIESDLTKIEILLINNNELKQIQIKNITNL